MALTANPPARNFLLLHVKHTHHLRTVHQESKAYDTMKDMGAYRNSLCLCAHRVVFVLKETAPEAWLNSGGGDFVATLKPPDLSDLVDKVVDAEANYSHWSLFNRFCMANEILDAADAAGAATGHADTSLGMWKEQNLCRKVQCGEAHSFCCTHCKMYATAGGRGMALIYVWLRLSTMKQLDWHRGSSYQSKDIAHAQKTIAQVCYQKFLLPLTAPCALYAFHSQYGSLQTSLHAAFNASMLPFCIYNR